jgi:hypothetical protein
MAILTERFRDVPQSLQTNVRAADYHADAAEKPSANKQTKKQTNNSVLKMYVSNYTEFYILFTSNFISEY